MEIKQITLPLNMLALDKSKITDSYYRSISSISVLLPINDQPYSGYQFSISSKLITLEAEKDRAILSIPMNATYHLTKWKYPHSTKPKGTNLLASRLLTILKPYECRHDAVSEPPSDPQKIQGTVAMIRCESGNGPFQPEYTIAFLSGWTAHTISNKKLSVSNPALHFTICHTICGTTTHGAFRSSQILLRTLDRDLKYLSFLRTKEYAPYITQFAEQLEQTLCKQAASMLNLPSKESK